MPMFDKKNLKYRGCCAIKCDHEGGKINWKLMSYYKLHYKNEDDFDKGIAPIEEWYRCEACGEIFREQFIT